MIEIKLKEVADRLGKSLTDIARETGLHRNTVNDLYHGRVDGIKFATIDVLCDTYGLNLSDFIVRKEFRIGGAPSSKIVREIQEATPFFSWFRLNALHAPSPTYFDGGIGKIYAYFVRGEVELYFDRVEANRFARRAYERYGRAGLEDVTAAFIRSRDQLISFFDVLSTQPLERFISADLVKTLQRAGEAYADMLSVSAWIDVFDFGVRDDLLRQMRKTHSFSAADISILLASGKPTAYTARRSALLDLTDTFIKLHPKKPAPDQGDAFVAENRDAKRYLRDYPFVSNAALAADIKAYASIPRALDEERNLLAHLPKRHADALKDVLRKHGMRANPLSFFAELAVWREERDEIDLRTRFHLSRILRIAAERFRLPLDVAPYLLPQEVKHAMNGLIGERALRFRSEQAMLVALERGEFKVYEGEDAVSVQDDLASRYASQIEYADVS
ncbi:MAG: helix-turn-helix transcriptional regulator [Patescibacteria group bacterium]|jgi:putative transcriptional regulator